MRLIGRAMVLAASGDLTVASWLRSGMFALAVWTGLFRLQSRTVFWNVVIASAVLLGLSGALLLINLVGFSAWLD
jgi:hypothetical protein